MPQQYTKPNSRRPDPSRPAFAINELPALLPLSRSTVFAEISAGRLKSFRVGNRRFVSRHALTQYIAEREAETDLREGRTTEAAV